MFIVEQSVLYDEINKFKDKGLTRAKEFKWNNEVKKMSDNLKLKL